MNHKVCELDGRLLDAAVAKAAGYPLDGQGDRLHKRAAGGAPLTFRPSTDWADGGPIIEGERICLTYGSNQQEYPGWSALVGPESYGDDPYASGPTPLVAAMRAFVISRLGEEIELP